ncbi:uncharacterized protein LOC144351935 [Saccoglossus kowalevskii]
MKTTNNGVMPKMFVHAVILLIVASQINSNDTVCLRQSYRRWYSFSGTRKIIDTNQCVGRVISYIRPHVADITTAGPNKFDMTRPCCCKVLNHKKETTRIGRVVVTYNKILKCGCVPC